MALVNLTPHTLNIVLPSGEVRTLPPSGEVARVAETRTPAGEIDGIPVDLVGFGEVTGLPAPQEGVTLVVSALVAGAVTGRSDVVSPGAPVRNADGVIIGARGLTRRA